MSEKNPKNELNIELTEEVAEGIYSNLAILNHSATEFVLDFVQIMPGIPKAKVKSRIVLTPQNTKRLLAALADNIRKYEAQFGTITESNAANALPFMNQNNIPPFNNNNNIDNDGGTPPQA